ncbi:MAG: choice-of-anchor D domain-containing protein [bacterium]
MRKIVYLFIFLFTYSAYSQSLSLFNIDASAFPHVKANFYALDSNGNQITNLTPADFTLKENGVVKKVTNVSCLDSKIPYKISIALGMRTSDNMNEEGYWEYYNEVEGHWPPIEISKYSMSMLINCLAIQSNQCVLQTCNETANIFHNFTNDKHSLFFKINTIKAEGGYNIAEQLLNPEKGLLNIIKESKNKRVVVLFTSPCTLSNLELKQCTDTCLKYNIRFYAVTHGPGEGIESLKTLAESTGGFVFDNCNVHADVDQIINDLQLLIQEGKPCEIEWESGSNCHRRITDVDLELNASNLNINTTSLWLNDYIPKFDFLPKVIEFKNVEIGKTKTAVVRLRAKYADFNVGKITCSNPQYKINSTNFILPKGQAMDLLVSYTPVDSGYSFTGIDFESNVCTATLFATGGFDKTKPQVSSLKLTQPNGGEKFVIGTDSLITWEGIPETSIVQLDYSVDYGSTWQNITNKASAGTYLWQNIPKPISNECLIRVSQLNSGVSDTSNLQFILGGHSDTVNLVRWSPDGKLIVSSGTDGKEIIWDALTGAYLNIDAGQDGSRDVIWSPDGSRLLKIEDFWQRATIINSAKREFYNLITNPYEICSASWSPDGGYIALSTWKGITYIWNAEDTSLVKKLVGHKRGINSVIWSPDGSHLATASYDSTAIIWNVTTGLMAQTLKGHKNYVINISWSPDGSKVASASYDSTGRIWDVNSGKELYVLRGHTGAINNICWNDDGTKVATSSKDSTSIIWDVTSGIMLFRLNGHTGQVNNVCWSPDGKLVFTSSSDSTAKIWDAATGINIKTLIGCEGSINDVRCSPDGKYVATASADRSVIIWDVSTSKPLKKCIGYSKRINDAQWSPDGTKVLTSGNNDHTAIIWDAITGAYINSLKGHTLDVNGVSWSPDGDRIATTSTDRTAIIWDSKTGMIIHKLIGHNKTIFKVSWSSDSKYITTSGVDSCTIIWDSNTGTLLKRINRQSNKTQYLKWSLDGKYFATVSQAESPEIWDTSNWKRIKVFSGINHFENDILWSPNGMLIAGIYGSNGIIWDLNTDKIIYQINKGAYRDVTNISWSPDGKYIGARISDGTVQIHDASTGTYKFTLKGYNDGVGCFAWSPNSNRISGISNNSRIKFWDAQTGEELQTLQMNLAYLSQPRLSTLDWSKDGSRVLTISEDATAKIWLADVPNITIQEDQSDKTFSIVAPNAKTIDVDMKQCLIGSKKDSLITNFIINTGLYKFRVNDIYFTGTDAGAFKVISGIPEYQLTPGKSKTTGFRFNPTREGIHTATINIVTQWDTLQQSIQGEGVPPKLQIISDTLDFGKIEIGTAKTFQDTVLIKNISNSDLTIKNVVQLGPDKTQFEILNGGGPFTLQQDETRKLTIRFKPINIGRTSNFLGFEYDGLGTPAKVQLYGEGVNNKPKLESNINNFPNLICQNSALTDLAIRNIGGKPLIVNSLTFKGLNPQDFSVPGFTGFTLNPNDSKQLTVLFKPKQIGTRYADIEIKSNAYPDSITILPISAKKDSLNLSYIESTIDLGFLCPNEMKDTVLTIKNFGSIKTGAYLVGNTNISLNNNELVLQPDGIFELSFTFDGLNSEGNINENITITDSICRISKRIFITGKVAFPKIEAQDLNIKSELNVSAQGVITIKNIGDRDITINTPPMISPPFKILGNSFPAIIKSKDSLKFAIEFLPTDIQDHFAKIYLPIEPCNFTKEVNIAGVVSSAKVTINNANCEAFPGDIIEIPISLLHATNLQYSGITGLDLDLIYNPTLLSPRDYSGESINNMNSKISFKNLPITGPDLTKIKFTVGLGNAQSCDLILEHVKPIGGTANIDVENGTFKLLGICREGGTRLINPTGKAEILSIMPNPASEDIEIKVNLIENGATIVSIFNSNGMKIKEYNIIGETGQKTINLNAKDFSNGLYFIQLQTPTVLENQKLMIIK